MSPSISEHTQATLLLTAPLLPRSSAPRIDLLRPKEYSGLVSTLSQSGRALEDLLRADAQEILEDIRVRIDPGRLSALLGRGMQLADAIDRWRTRGMWVVGLGDPGYPPELVERLGESAPPVLYGCGDQELLRVAGLAIVGSRDASPTAMDFARSVAEEAARSGVPVISGGARGIDASAMRSALQAGGSVLGILAQRLDRAAVAGENREHLVTGQLLLLSPYDPGAGFNVGHAMARNKLIYAFADAALIASADRDRGGTWAGAIEQLEQETHMPLYVRADRQDDALAALVERGAEFWPERADARSLANQSSHESTAAVEHLKPTASADVLFDRACQLLSCLEREYSRAELEEYLGVTSGQLNAWLPRFLSHGVLERASKRPVRYRKKSPALPL